MLASKIQVAPNATAANTSTSGQCPRRGHPVPGQVTGDQVEQPCHGGRAGEPQDRDGADVVGRAQAVADVRERRLICWNLCATSPDNSKKRDIGEGHDPVRGSGRDAWPESCRPFTAAAPRPGTGQRAGPRRRMRAMRHLRAAGPGQVLISQRSPRKAVLMAHRRGYRHRTDPHRRSGNPRAAFLARAITARSSEGGYRTRAHHAADGPHRR